MRMRPFVSINQAAMVREALGVTAKTDAAISDGAFTGQCDSDAATKRAVYHRLAWMAACRAHLKSLR
jgi:hypothetical protein